MNFRQIKSWQWALLVIALSSFFRRIHRPLIALTERAVAFGERPDAPRPPNNTHCWRTGSQSSEAPVRAGGDAPVYMTGPAETVFEGEIEL